MLLIRAEQDAVRETHIPIKNNPKQENNNKLTVTILERNQTSQIGFSDVKNSVRDLEQ